MVRGDEVAAVESADINAITNFRLTQATAQALVSLQEVRDENDPPSATNTEATQVTPAPVDVPAAQTGNTGETTATLDANTQPADGANIDVQSTGQNTGQVSSQSTGQTTTIEGASLDTATPTGVGTADQAPDIEVTLPDGTVSAGGSSGPPRGAVLDIVV